jgi:hypothetical protein
MPDAILHPDLVFRDVDRDKAEEIRRWFRPAWGACGRR